jgi:PHD/YefM family antitoxin component YafN of YafNO toxin-antitoxin module
VTNLRRSAAVQAAFCDAGKMPALPLRCHYILRTSLSITFVKTHLVTTLKRNATKILTQLVKDRSPVLITQLGTSTAYRVDVVSFEALQNRMQIFEGIARGERAIQEGRVSTPLQAKQRLKRWRSSESPGK